MYFLPSIRAPITNKHLRRRSRKMGTNWIVIFGQKISMHSYFFALSRSFGSKEKKYRKYMQNIVLLWLSISISIRKRHHTLLLHAKMIDYEIGFLLAFLNNDSYFFSDEEIGFLGYLDQILQLTPGATVAGPLTTKPNLG